MRHLFIVLLPLGLSRAPLVYLLFCAVSFSQIAISHFILNEMCSVEDCIDLFNGNDYKESIDFPRKIPT